MVVVVVVAAVVVRSRSVVVAAASADNLKPQTLDSAQARYSRWLQKLARLCSKLGTVAIALPAHPICRAKAQSQTVGGTVNSATKRRGVDLSV